MNDLAKLFGGMAAIPHDTPVIDPLELFDADGVLMSLPSAYWASKSRAEKMLFGHTHGLYAFPTSELVAELHSMIGGRVAIEIGAGNGGIARALAIPATDSHQQSNPAYAAIYELAGQPTVTYGPHVEKLEATLAVAKYAPKVIVAAWVTHLYDPRRHELGGNVVGVDEQNIMEAVDDYIFIGNTAVHATKPLLHDLNAGKITSHVVKEYFVGSPMLQSRSSRGVDFLIRLGRK